MAGLACRWGALCCTAGGPRFLLQQSLSKPPRENGLPIPLPGWKMPGPSLCARSRRQWKLYREGHLSLSRPADFRTDGRAKQPSLVFGLRRRQARNGAPRKLPDPAPSSARRPCRLESELIPKLRQGITAEDSKTKLMEFESNEDLKGKDHLGFLYNALKYKTPLKISYQPFQSEKADILIFHPYFLKQFNGRWFLFGLNPATGKSDWNLAIDRIVELENASLPFIENTAIDWVEYFEDIIGVTKPEGEGIQAITLHFYGKTGRYIETKPIHAYQKNKWLDANTLEIRLELIPNYELERLVLSYAEFVKVITPPALAQRIANRHQQAKEHYVTSVDQI